MDNMILGRLAALRELMRQEGLSAYIIPGTDPHASEYMADHWKETTFISGFKGETGTVVVTLTEAWLWTDSRYYLQADKELAGSSIGLMKESEIDTPSIATWLKAQLQRGEQVGVNPEMFSVQGYESLQTDLSSKGLSVKSVDLIRPLWTADRPAIPSTPLYGYDKLYAGESVQEKLNRVRDCMREADADVFVTSALDEIAWIFNIRGGDVEFNPVVISFALIEQTRCTLFVAPEKITEEGQRYLHEQQIEVKDYEAIYTALHNLNDCTVLYDGARLNRALYEAIPTTCQKTDKQSPILLLKSRKNSTEIEGERIAMHKDAVALTRFFIWLEQAVGQEQLTEYDLMRKLHSFRTAGENFVEESFETIAGWKGNGAIVHYQATSTDCASIDGSGLLLLDSGGQYLEGTTDITRTIWVGDIPQAGSAEKALFDKICHDYTLVMKGHIALACARFPRGTRGNQLDILARQYLWQENLSYGHGTGHGVGHFLGCHEGPQNIRTDNNPTPLEIGMICSDEPGIYRAGEYGIRTENLITVIPAATTEFGEFLQFETLTLCYYDTRLLDLSLLTEQEKEWINNYHKRVTTEICPLLNAEEAAWLQTKCHRL